MTIEHLAPQSQSIKSHHIGNVGNLLLCEKGFNSNVLKDKNFSAKKAALTASQIAIDPIVKAATEWTAKEIAARAKYMADIAFNKAWKL